MIEAAVRKFGEKTRHDYIRHVEAFARFLGHPPDTATAEDVRRFQVHLTESGMQPPTLNSSASALRFFFGITLDRAEVARHLARVHYPRKLPRVLSPEEVARLLEAAPGPGLKYKAALSIAYGAGLRAGEVGHHPARSALPRERVRSVTQRGAPQLQRTWSPRSPFVDGVRRRTRALRSSLADM
jgi:site-specific recombinase XerD